MRSLLPKIENSTLSIISFVYLTVMIAPEDVAVSIIFTPLLGVNRAYA